MDVHCEQEGAEHTALGGSCSEESRRGMTANQNCLGSACEEVQYLVSECGIQAQRL